MTEHTGGRASKPASLIYGQVMLSGAHEAGRQLHFEWQNFKVRVCALSLPRASHMLQ